METQTHRSTSAAGRSAEIRLTGTEPSAAAAKHRIERSQLFLQYQTNYRNINRPSILRTNVVVVVV